MNKFEMKELELVKNGKRQVKLCNGIRSQVFDKVKEILIDNGFDAVVAANGDIALPIAVDAETGKTFYFRLAASFTNKDLDSKIEKKPVEKKEVDIPNLFAE